MRTDPARQPSQVSDPVTIRRVQEYFPVDVRPIVSACLVIGVAIGIFGLSFGVVAVASGTSVAQACVMSLLVFTGASQLSAVSVIAMGGSMASALGGAYLLACRNLVYGLSMAPTLDGPWWHRVIGAQLVIDETTAISTAQADPRLRKWAFWVSGILFGTLWNVGTLVGAVLGSSIDPQTFGLDVAFPVMFTTMIVPHLATRAGKRAAMFGAVAVVATAPFLPIGLPVLVAAFGTLFGLSPDRNVTSSNAEHAS